MAQSLYKFDIDDDSPEIAYFPFANLEPSQNVTAGWELLYTVSAAANGPGQVGVGTSYHYTSVDGASLMVNWTGTGIVLSGAVSDALYNVSLDGIPSPYFADPANAVLASLHDLPNANHSLLLTTIITNTSSPDAFLTFDKARVTYAPPSGLINTTATSQTIDDSDIAYMGSWTFLKDSSGNAMHVSNSAGDHLTTTFTGFAITIYGLTSSYSGNFSVTIDNTTTSLSALSSYNNSDTLLFYSTDLLPNVSHHVTVVNQQNRTLALRVGGLNVTCFPNFTTSSTSLSRNTSIPAGTIAAVALAAVLFLVIVGILYFACLVRIRRNASARDRPTFLRGARKRFNEEAGTDIGRVIVTTPSSRGELESTSLSTTKGYGFGLGLRFPFAYRKGKTGSGSSGRSPNGNHTLAESHPMTSQYDRDEKRFSMFTLTEDVPQAPESEKLAPGWYNPVARVPPSFDYTRCYKDARAISLPELRVVSAESVDDDADVKTLASRTSRQEETLAAVLSLSPRTSEALAVRPIPAKPNDTRDTTKYSRAGHQAQFLNVRDTSPFRVDVSAIIGNRRDNRDSRATTGSVGSTWSKVRARLYRKAHHDDGRKSCTDRRETSSSLGPEIVPVLLHESGSIHPPSETVHDSGTYSFLDFTSSRASLQPHSKHSSAPAEVGHGPRDASTWSENASMKVVRIERSRDETAPKPDAPSTASGGSQPSDNSGNRTVPSDPTEHTQRSSPFPFPVTIPPATDATPPLPPTSDVVERRPTLDHLQVPRIAPPELAVSAASSPTESVPFSVSDIYFRHSFSDYAGLDSQRASVSSALPPHPPLPHRDGSQSSPPTYTPPPPYIVQRVLGMQLSSLSPLSPSTVTIPHTTSGSPTSTIHRSGPGSTPPGSFRVGLLLGPRPRPSTAGSTGSIRGSSAPQLPMQGGRGNMRTRPR